jgi:hypothetical protein
LSRGCCTRCPTNTCGYATFGLTFFLFWTIMQPSASRKPAQ